MAKLDFNIPKDLERGLARRLDFNRLAPLMIDGATPIVKEQVVKNAQLYRETGELAGSIKVQKAIKLKKSGAWSGKVFFDGYSVTQMRKGRVGYRRIKVANAQKAMSLEYGTEKQNPTPFLLPAINAAEDKAVDAMQETYTKEVGKG